MDMSIYPSLYKDFFEDGVAENPNDDDDVMINMGKYWQL